MVPVLVVDYSSFDPLSLLRDLMAARNLRVSKCVWQLGDYSMKVTSKYVEDLKTLKLLCESVNKEHNVNWNVAAAGSSNQLNSEKFPFEVIGYDVMR